MNKQSQGRCNSFDEFWTDFVTVLRLAREKKTSGQVIKLLKRQSGFVPNEEQVNRVYQQLRELANPDALEFSVFVAARSRQMPSRILVGLGDRIGAKYRSIGESQVADHPTWTDIREWMSARFMRARAEKLDLTNIARAIFANLLNVRDREFYASSLLFLADQIGGKTRKKTDSARNELETLLAELLSKKQLSRKQAVVIVRLGRSMREAVDVALDQRRQMIGKVESLEQQVSKLQAELEDRGNQLLAQSESIDTLKAELSTAKDAQARAQGRVEGTEEHWSVVSKQQLVGIVSKLRNEIDHETKEIVLCLDRDIPNTDMALQRTRMIEKILEKAKSAI